MAGFLDASGGGGWGPVSTSSLLARDGEPRRVVGSVDTSEVAVSFAATLGFLITLGWSGINLAWVLALVAGGLNAAPIAAFLAGRLPAPILGVLIGGMIVLTNLRTLLGTFHVEPRVSTATWGCWLPSGSAG